MALDNNVAPKDDEDVEMNDNEVSHKQEVVENAEEPMKEQI